MATDTLKIKGYREFLRASDKAEKESKRFVRDNFHAVGEIVRKPAALDLHDLSRKSAAGLRTIVRVRGVNVEQTLRRTTGKRPDWGATQMRKILIPNLADKQREIEKEVETSLDRIADHFERQPPSP